jgi:hypothetical protein
LDNVIKENEKDKDCVVTLEVTVAGGRSYFVKLEHRRRHNKKDFIESLLNKPRETPIDFALLEASG